MFHEIVAIEVIDDERHLQPGNNANDIQVDDIILDNLA